MILKNRQVLVDGRARTDLTFPAGFMGKSQASCLYLCLSTRKEVAIRTALFGVKAKLLGFGTVRRHVF